jgi:hypothetical protein
MITSVPGRAHVYQVSDSGGGREIKVTRGTITREMAEELAARHKMHEEIAAASAKRVAAFMQSIGEPAPIQKIYQLPDLSDLMKSVDDGVGSDARATRVTDAIPERETGPKFSVANSDVLGLQRWIDEIKAEA